MGCILLPTFQGKATTSSLKTMNSRNDKITIKKGKAKKKENAEGDSTKTSIEEFKEEKNKEHFNREVLKPILQEFYNKVYPYVRILFIMYGLNLVLIITILVITPRG